MKNTPELPSVNTDPSFQWWDDDRPADNSVVHVPWWKNYPEASDQLNNQDPATSAPPLLLAMNIGGYRNKLILMASIVAHLKV